MYISQCVRLQFHSITRKFYSQVRTYKRKEGLFSQIHSPQWQIWKKVEISSQQKFFDNFLQTMIIVYFQNC